MRKKATPLPSLQSQPEQGQMIQEQQPESLQQLQPPVPSAEGLPQPLPNTPEADPAAQPDFDSIKAGLGASPVEEMAASGGVLTKDQFFAGLGGCFTMASAVTRLKSLEIEPGDRIAREASDAIYDTAAEIPMFNFLIRPGNVYVQRALVIFVFAKTKADAVKDEVMAKRMQQAPQPGHSQAMRSSPASDPSSDDFGKAA